MYALLSPLNTQRKTLYTLNETFAKKDRYTFYVYEADRLYERLGGGGGTFSKTKCGPPRNIVFIRSFSQTKCHTRQTSTSAMPLSAVLGK